MNHLSRPCLAAAACLVVALSSAAHGQAAGVAIEPKRYPSGAPTPEVLATLGALKDARKLLSIDQVEQALANPTPQSVTLPAPSTEALRPTAIATRVRASNLRIGWYHLCNRCNNWHLNIAGGYLLTADGVGATCHHVVQPSRQSMREGYLFAMSDDGSIFPITQILATDRDMDATIFKLDEASGLVPLPINDLTRPGDAVFLRSDPGGVAGYFSEGIINRFYWDGTKRSGDPMKLSDARSLRMDVSTDWSPGSSGAALVDECGNAVGHVSKIYTITAADQAPQPQPGQQATDPTTRRSSADSAPATRPAVGTQLILHEATPIRSVRLLIEQMNMDAADDTTPATNAVP